MPGNSLAWQSAFVILSQTPNMTDAQAVLIKDAIELGDPVAFMADDAQWGATFGQSLADVITRAHELFEPDRLILAFDAMGTLQAWMVDHSVMMAPLCDCDLEDCPGGQTCSASYCWWNGPYVGLCK